MGVNKSLHGMASNFNHPVQKYANTLPYMLGGLTLVCLVLLMLSGMYMALFYIPTAQQAYSSTLNLIENVPFGEYARSIHLWAANIIIVMIGLHLARVIITGSYKKPRRMLYFVGLAMFFTILFLTYLGTTLTLDQIGADAAIRSQQTAALFGLSIPISQMVGPDAVAHTSIMIVALLLLLAIHMYLIEKIGISPKVTKNAIARTTAGEGTSNFLTHLKLLAGFGCILTAFIGTLALISPAPIGHPGVYDPTIMITKPVEAILFVNDKMLDVFGPYSLIWGPALLFVLLLLFPLVDRNPHVYWRKRIPAMLLGIFILAWALYFIYIDATAPTQYSGICATPPSNGVCVPALAENQTVENVTVLENESLGAGTKMYFISNGTAATPADVYGGFIDVPSKTQGETPYIIAALVVLAGAGVVILASDRLKRMYR